MTNNWRRIGRFWRRMIFMFNQFLSGTSHFTKEFQEMVGMFRNTKVRPSGELKKKIISFININCNLEMMNYSCGLLPWWTARICWLLIFATLWLLFFIISPETLKRNEPNSSDNIIRFDFLVFQFTFKIFKFELWRFFAGKIWVAPARKKDYF